MEDELKHVSYNLMIVCFPVSEQRRIFSKSQFVHAVVY